MEFLKEYLESIGINCDNEADFKSIYAVVLFQVFKTKHDKMISKTFGNKEKNSILKEIKLF